LIELSIIVKDGDSVFNNTPYSVYANYGSTNFVYIGAPSSGLGISGGSVTTTNIWAKGRAMALTWDPSSHKFILNTVVGTDDITNKMRFIWRTMEFV